MAFNPLVPPGAQPNPLIPPGGMPPPLPMLPPPPSPSLGFQAWASDPRNAMLVQHAMIAPDAPLQPNAGSAAANPPKPAPMASANPPQTMASSAPPVMNIPQAGLPNVPAPPAPPPVQSQTQADQGELRRLQTNGAGLNQIKNPFLKGLAHVGDIAGAMLLGRGEAMIPGTTAHNLMLQGQQKGIIGQDQAAQTAAQQQAQAQAQLADTQSQTGQRIAQTGKLGAQADADQPVTLSAEQAAAIGHPELVGQDLNPRALALMLAGKQKADSGQAIATGKNATLEQVAAERNANLNNIAAAANKTKLLVQGMKDNTSSSNTAARINAKGIPGAPGAAGGKVPADVTKRAALAANVNENADAVQALVQRRPDIVGATGGRYSNVQQMIGSNDPDIQALGVHIHNMALAGNGAHGVRSAEAVKQTENELFNNFKSGPQGITGALNATRSSVQTFLDDEKNFQTTGKRTGNNMIPPTQGSSAPNSNAMITAQIPGQPAGQIHASQKAAFLAKYPNAKVQ